MPVFSVPPRPLGMPYQFDGIYWMRSGESLVAVTLDHLCRIFDEDFPDFSAHICGGATVDDLDAAAITELRECCIRKLEREDLRNLSGAQLLTNAEPLTDRGLTYAALILLVKHESLGRLMAHLKVFFEYRFIEMAGAAEQREEYRQGYFLYLDDI